jgi:hypothetical protein
MPARNRGLGQQPLQRQLFLGRFHRLFLDFRECVPHPHGGAFFFDIHGGTALRGFTRHKLNGIRFGDARRPRV